MLEHNKKRDITFVLVGMTLPDSCVFVWRYILTIGLVIGLVHIPLVKRIFM